MCSAQAVSDVSDGSMGWTQMRGGSYVVRQEAREWERIVVNLGKSHMIYFNLLQGYCLVFCN